MLTLKGTMYGNTHYICDTHNYHWLSLILAYFRLSYVTLHQGNGIKSSSKGQRLPILFVGQQLLHSFVHNK